VAGTLQGMKRPPEKLGHGQARLRRWRAADADELYRVVSDCLDHLRPWMPWADGYDRSRAEQFVTLSEHDWQAGVAFHYAILSDGAVAGSCGLMRRVGPGGMELGYWLHPAYTGRGLATAATAALVEQAFGLPGVDHVLIVHDLANTASGAIPRRLGFDQVERRARSQPGAPGEAGVDLVWRLTREQAARHARQGSPGHGDGRPEGQDRR
jgi:ribosomal-protein-serine acetyltransferase